MAIINHQSYHHTTTTAAARHHQTRYLRRHSLDYATLPTTTTTLKPTTSTTTTTTFAISPTSTTTPTAASSAATSTTFTLDALERHLAAQNFRQADEETRRLLIILAGEPAIKRGYVFFSEVQFISKDDLIAMDELWKKYSDGKFGYSVQKKIWVKVNKDFTRFFMKVGWMKKLDTEIEQYNYRSFPNEFMWELNPTINGDDDQEKGIVGVPPEGHLPLTNALRGTQLLNCIFNHPAFAEEGDEEKGNNGGENRGNEMNSNGGEADKKKSRLEALRDRLFKPNYSF